MVDNVYCIFCFVFVVLCLDVSDVIARKVCSSHGTRYITIAATPASNIASAQEHDQGKTKPTERPK